MISLNYSWNSSSLFWNIYWLKLLIFFHNIIKIPVLYFFTYCIFSIRFPWTLKLILFLESFENSKHFFQIRIFLGYKLIMVYVILINYIILYTIFFRTKRYRLCDVRLWEYWDIQELKTRFLLLVLYAYLNIKNHTCICK